MNLMVPYTPVMILDDSGNHPTPVMWNQGKDISPLGVEFFAPVFLFADNLVITPGDRLVIRDVYFKIRKKCCISRFSSADCLFFTNSPDEMIPGLSALKFEYSMNLGIQDFSQLHVILPVKGFHEL